ncbi:MAG: 50S ribosomal protein L18 [Elusimicrobia bacterium CG1_02_37_114]|nr:MAG: 50S ribosomal protein L18 [Elusimicrobia bacterium CG1_02_37_114]PIV52552.1 MAG: 50S ribosomal protein L18 [Elusimicrobia bacterium CG02_land_8_20_14_3_00_37_13]PIZ13281.1 MAG: 50S ribosomal protein L18 [Elusimicrobia bacterium CG_4_10_14_0_8_um_filter_37_32]
MIKKIFGTGDRPRLNVYRSLKNIYAQIIDDEKRHVLVSASSLSGELKDKIQKKPKTECAKDVGILLAKKALQKDIKKVVFDRGGRKYHGRLKALAEGARSVGLVF